MIDMVHAGAVAFSDGRKHPIEAGLLTRAMEYVIPYNSLIIDFPLDRSLTAEGQMHEGKVSTSMGLIGIPSVGEEITVQRDIQLVAYTRSRLHFHAISAAASIPLIQKAKGDKLMPSPVMYRRCTCCSKTRMSGDFNSHLKVLPPLREVKRP